MADTQPFVPNPYANFDPSQFSNPFSRFASGALPWPSSYVRTPTDAFGNPIQGFVQEQQAAQAQAPQATPGTTLNTAPQWTGLGGGKPSPSEWQTANNAANPNPADAAMVSAMTMGGALDPSGSNMFAADPWTQGRRQPAPQAQAPAFDSYQAALSGLANPGPLRPVGATAPQSSGVQPGGGVLQNFLQNWQPGTSGPGSGFTKAFSQGLRGK